MLEPQCHSEAMDLALCRAAGCKVVRLVSSHSDFGVTSTIQGSLVDVGRTHYYVLIVNCKQQDKSPDEHITARNGYSKFHEPNLQYNLLSQGTVAMIRHDGFLKRRMSKKRTLICNQCNNKSDPGKSDKEVIWYRNDSSQLAIYFHAIKERLRE